MIQRPITSYHSGWRKAKDRIFFWLVCLFSALTAVPLVVIIWEVVRKGYKQINLNFFTETAPSTLDAMLAKINGEIIPGGIANGITGTLLMVVLASVIAIPTGIMNLLIGKTQNLIFSCDPFSDRPPARHAVDRHRYHRLCLGCRSFE